MCLVGLKLPVPPEFEMNVTFHMGLETPNNLEVDSKIECLWLMSEISTSSSPTFLFVPILIPLELSIQWGGLWVKLGDFLKGMITDKLKTTNSWVQMDLGH